MYVGGQFTAISEQGITNFGKWDGTNWFSVGGGVDKTVRAIAVSDMGDIFVGGDFSSAGGIAASHLARWDGVNWTTLGTGVNGEVDALAWGAGGLYAPAGFRQPVYFQRIRNPEAGRQAESRAGDHGHLEERVHAVGALVFGNSSASLSLNSSRILPRVRSTMLTTVVGYTFDS